VAGCNARASSAPHRIAWGEDGQDVTADFAKPAGNIRQASHLQLLRSHEEHRCHDKRVIHLRVVSPSAVTSMLMPALRAEQAVMNLTLHPAAASNRLARPPMLAASSVSTSRPGC